MTTRAKQRARAEARRKEVEFVREFVPRLPLWPWDATQWAAPAVPAKRGRGRPPKVQRPVDRMIEARGVLYNRVVKKADTAKTVAPQAKAARLKIGDRRRARVLAMAARLRSQGVPARRLSSHIVAALDLAGLRVDVKHVREILKAAGLLPAS